LDTARNFGQSAPSFSMNEGEAEEVGAKKSPRKVGLFVLTLMVGVVIALGLVLLYLHFHTPALR